MLLIPNVDVREKVGKAVIKQDNILPNFATLVALTLG